MFANTSESESAIIIPPIKKARIKARNGRSAAFRNDSNLLSII
jgi:hypothetical protein